jgi:CBS domain-containing protein
VRRSKYGLLPVVSDDGYLLGMITAGMIESKIANEVIATQEQE